MCGSSSKICHVVQMRAPKTTRKNYCSSTDYPVIGLADDACNHWLCKLKPFVCCCFNFGVVWFGALLARNRFTTPIDPLAMCLVGLACNRSDTSPCSYYLVTTHHPVLSDYIPLTTTTPSCSLNSVPRNPTCSAIASWSLYLLLLLVMIVVYSRTVS